MFQLRASSRSEFVMFGPLLPEERSPKNEARDEKVRQTRPFFITCCLLVFSIWQQESVVAKLGRHRAYCA